jgi:phosphoglycolate phosphatase-like HAD superfamily hydrolase
VTDPSRILIFDLDGTLVDSMGPATELFARMLLEDCGIPDAISRPVYTRLMGKGPQAQFAAVLRHVEAWDEALVQDLTDRYWEAAERDVPDLYPDVRPALESLRDEGHMLIVSSGSIQRSAERKTRIADIEQLFRLILGSDEDAPERAKGPGHFAMIAEALSLPAGDLQARGVFIGDGVYDMQIAQEAGMTAIGRLTGDNADELIEAGADHVIRELGELQPLM